MELKDVLSLLNIDDVSEETELDAFKEKFVSKFGIKTEIEEEKKKLGQRFGSAETEIKRLFKENGVEFEDGETKDKGLEDLVALGVTKHLTLSEAKIKELKDKVGQTEDKKFQDLQAKLDAQQSQWTQDKEMLDKLKGELEESKTGFETEKKNWIITDRVKTAKSKVQFIDNITEVQKKGFDAILSEKAKFEIDDNNNVYPVDPQTGKKFENPTKVGDYLDMDEFMKAQAIEQRLFKNNDGGGQQKTTGFVQNNNNGSEHKKPIRQVHPSLR